MCTGPKPVDRFGRWPSSAHQSAGSKPLPCLHISSCSSSVSHWPMTKQTLGLIEVTHNMLALPPTTALHKRTPPTSKKMWPSWRGWALRAWNTNHWLKTLRRPFATRSSRDSAVRPLRQMLLLLQEGISAASKLFIDGVFQQLENYFWTLLRWSLTFPQMKRRQNGF